MKGKDLKEKLGYEAKPAWDVISEKEKKQIFKFCEDYKNFLDKSKTERQTVNSIVTLARQAGFVPLGEIIEANGKLNPGDKVMIANREKNVILAVIGENPLIEGINIIGSHIDSPRLDLKPSPLYEDQNLALLKTHYYGGIKKYQWTALSLALHGVVIKNNGEKVEVIIGEKETDPVFTITDLLPHLAKDQIAKKLGEAISGEGLNILVGSIPVSDKDVKERVKLAVLAYLDKEYGIKEEDFITAELEVVPAGKARDVGFDRSFVGAYGQDDRVCAYTSLKAVLEIDRPKATALALFVDKEEIGSTGNTGMQSMFFENVVAELLYYSVDRYNEIYFRRCLSNSAALSADVSAALDPNYPEVYDKLNSVRCGYGVAINKYTGAGGKYNASDASAEFMASVKRLFSESKIPWQQGELGKVDQGGGGTIAKFMASYDMEVLDCGVALLGMHSPFEIASKIDIYYTYKAYKVFFERG